MQWWSDYLVTEAIIFCLGMAVLLRCNKIEMMQNVYCDTRNDRNFSVTVWNKIKNKIK